MSDNQYYTLLTDRGREKLRAAILSGEKLHLTHMAVGDGGTGAIEPHESMTALVNEVYRGGITNNSVDPHNPTWTVLNLVIPVDVGGWYVREAGIFDADGELIFIGSLPENYKALPTQGVASDLAVNLIVDIQRADSVTIVVDPSTVLASQEWTGQVVESCMRLHDEDPAAHDALIARLIEFGHMVGKEEIDVALSQSVDEAVARSLEQAAQTGTLRTRLQADLTLYLRTNGDDASDGLTEATAKGSFAAICDRLVQIDPAQHTVTVDIGAGEYPVTDIPEIAGYTYKNLILTGAGSEATRLVGPITCASCTATGVGFVDYLNVSGTTSLRDIAIFGDSGVGGIQVLYGKLLLGGPIRVVGSPRYTIFANRGGYITCASSTHFHCESASFLKGCVTALRSGVVDLYTSVFSGEATGPRYQVGEGGRISWLTAPLSALPGDRPGTIENRDEHIVASGQRIPLRTDIDLYVAAGGNDSNDGLSVRTAKATLSGALRELTRYDLGYHQASIQIGPGRFAFPAALTGELMLGLNSRLKLIGSGKDETTLTGNLWAYGCPGISFYNLSVEGTMRSADASCLWLYSVRIVGVGDMGLNTFRGGQIVIQDELCELQGEFTEVLRATQGGSINLTYPVSISDTLTCNSFCAAASRGSIQAVYGWNYPERVTGRKWSLAGGGMLLTQTGNPDLELPGTLPGLSNPIQGHSSIKGVSRACGQVHATGTLATGTGIASSTRADAGTYRIEFIDTAANNLYAVVPSVHQGADNTERWDVVVKDKTTTGLTLVTRQNGVAADAAFSFVTYW